MNIENGKIPWAAIDSSFQYGVSYSIEFMFVIPSNCEVLVFDDDPEPYENCLRFCCFKNEDDVEDALALIDANKIKPIAVLQIHGKAKKLKVAEVVKRYKVGEES